MAALRVYPPVVQEDLFGDRRVAIVAERLIDMRGGERVVTAVADMIPHAQIFATVVDEERVPNFGGRRVHTSFVQKMPGSKRFFRAYLPLYPMAVEQLDLRKYDVVISLSSAFAHGALTDPSTVHVCYCHSPLRFAWSWAQDYARRSNPLTRAATGPLLHYVRSWDVAASHRVDSYVANSRNVQQRLWKYYRRQSTVVHPPVDTDHFMPSKTTGDHYLTVSSLSEHKRVDIAVAAFSRLGLPLYVVGDGPDAARLRKRAAPNVKFLGRVDEQKLTELYATCKAFVFPSDEDFGIAPVEAQACGRPVIAYGSGGALETVLPGVTGELFADQSAAALEEALQDFNPDAYRSADIRENALRFSINRFKQEFGRLLADTVEEYDNNASYTWPRSQAL